MTKTSPKHLYENSRLAKILQARIDKLAPIKTQRQISEEIGYDKPNVVSMYKRGEAKVPLDKLPDFARVLDLDLAMLFRAGLEQWWPNAHKATSQMFSERIVTKNEREILAYIQEMAPDEDPALTDKLRGAIRDALHVEPHQSVSA